MAEPWTIGSLLQWTTQYFRDKGIDNPRLDADVLLSFLLGKDRLYLYVHFEQPMQTAELAAYREMVKQRAARVPVAYITGRKEFMGLEFQVSSAVLIPRPDTEILVEAATARLAEIKQGLILDVGTGSGAVLVGTLARNPACQGVGTDISPAALEVAKVNANRLLSAGQATFQQTDLFPAEAVLYDAILSNPPYITMAEMEALTPEVLQEPKLALCGGSDGLDFYRRLVDGGISRLKPAGFMAVEVGAGQARQVAELAEQAGWRTEQIILDYAGIERVVVLRPAAAKAVEI
jgi:release factor glutamine methyltransferase